MRARLSTTTGAQQPAEPQRPRCPSRARPRPGGDRGRRGSGPAGRWRPTASASVTSCSLNLASRKSSASAATAEVSARTMSRIRSANSDDVSQGSGRTPARAACSSNRAQQATMPLRGVPSTQQLHLVLGVVAHRRGDGVGGLGAGQDLELQVVSTQRVASAAGATAARAPARPSVGQRQRAQHHHRDREDLQDQRRFPSVLLGSLGRAPGLRRRRAGRGRGRRSEAPKPSPSTTVPGPMEAAQVTSSVTITATHATATAAARLPSYGAAGDSSSTAPNLARCRAPADGRRGHGPVTDRQCSARCPRRRGSRCRSPADGR